MLNLLPRFSKILQSKSWSIFSCVEVRQQTTLAYQILEWTFVQFINIYFIYKTKDYKNRNELVWG